MNQLQPIVEESLASSGIKHQVIDCDPDFADTASFCEHYNFSPSQAANTILVVGKGENPIYAVCVLLATTKLDVNKKVCELLNVKRASFASGEQTIDQTGMMIGGVTVFGIKNLPIYVDSAVMEQAEVIMGGGNRSTKVLLAPLELKKLTNLQVIEQLAQPRT